MHGIEYYTSFSIVDSEPDQHGEQPGRFLSINVKFTHYFNFMSTTRLFPVAVMFA